MRYIEISPGQQLRSYVKCYYSYESSSEGPSEDIVFPSGCMELIFNLGSGIWESESYAGYVRNPMIEFWGQVTAPLPVRSMGKQHMLGIRFLPHGAACFLKEKMHLFNGQVFDGLDVGGKDIKDLHEQLLQAGSLEERIALIEIYLIRRLSWAYNDGRKLNLLDDVLQKLRSFEEGDSINGLALDYGLSARYLQKLFVEQTGLSPKLYNKINRFQSSLRLIARKDLSLTSVAYECGYFDQSHFIREFRQFTGTTPSSWRHDHSPLSLATAGN